MIYLIVSIIFMAILPVFFRMGVRAGAGALGINVVFRATAGAIMLAVAMCTTDTSRLHEIWGLVGWAGVVGAVLFGLAGFASIKAVQLGHLGTSWTILRCSMIIPTLASLFYWCEVPLVPVSLTLVMRLAGVAVATSAIVLLGLDRTKKRNDTEQVSPSRRTSKAWYFWVSTAMLGQGGWEVVLRSTRALPDDRS